MLLLCYNNPQICHQSGATLEDHVAMVNRSPEFKVGGFLRTAENFVVCWVENGGLLNRNETTKNQLRRLWTPKGNY